MNEFQIFAHGESFDVDAFLATTTLKIDHVWRGGDPRQNACVVSTYKTSGVTIVLGDGRLLPYWEQDEIELLGKFRTVELLNSN